MKTQLGLYSMEDGGSVPEINVSEQASENIKHLIGFLKLENSLITSSQGRVNIEYDYNLCYNEKFKDNLFVICQVRTYENSSLTGNKFKVYAFDMEGYEIPFEQDEVCIDGFYENCYILKENFA